METVILVIHLLLALAIIGLVLIQRSSGGGLGIGGGGMGDFATARGTRKRANKNDNLLCISFLLHKPDAGISCGTSQRRWCSGYIRGRTSSHRSAR